MFAEGPDLPDLGRVKLEEQNSKGSSGTSLLQRSFLISKELRVHGQVGVCMARRGGEGVESVGHRGARELQQCLFLISKELRMRGQVGVCMARRGGQVWRV